MLNLIRTSDYLAMSVEKLGFKLMSATHGDGLPLVAFRLDPNHKHNFDEFAVAHQLRQRGWVVPAYTMAPKTDGLRMMRVVVREDFSRSRCDALVKDIKLAVDTLKKMNDKQIEDHEKLVKAQAPRAGERMNQQFKHEKHSLHGKTGKTHAVC